MSFVPFKWPGILTEGLEFPVLCPHKGTVVRFGAVIHSISFGLPQILRLQKTPGPSAPQFAELTILNDLLVAINSQIVDTEFEVEAGDELLVRMHSMEFNPGFSPSSWLTGFFQLRTA